MESKKISNEVCESKEDNEAITRKRYNRIPSHPRNQTGKEHKYQGRHRV